MKNALAATLAVALAPVCLAVSPPPGAMLPAEPTASQPVAAGNPSFQLDARGNVYHLDASFGRIHKNGRSTGYTPDDWHDRFLVTPGGDVVYEDSFGKLRKNGANLGANFRREGQFAADDAGNVYWVKDFAGEEIYRNGYATGYEIQDGSPFAVSPEGVVQWVDEDGVMHLDDQPAGVSLRPGSFLRDPAGRYYYMVHVNGSRFRLLRLDPESGQVEFLAILVRRHFLRRSADGDVWHLDHTGTLHRNGQATSLKAVDFRLDGQGRVYRLWQNQLHRGTQPLGYQPRGHWDVSRGGAVVYVGEYRDVYRNGQNLGFELR